MTLAGYLSSKAERANFTDIFYSGNVLSSHTASASAAVATNRRHFFLDVPRHQSRIHHLTALHPPGAVARVQERSVPLTSTFRRRGEIGRRH